MSLSGNGTVPLGLPALRGLSDEARKRFMEIAGYSNSASSGHSTNTSVSQNRASGYFSDSDSDIMIIDDDEPEADMLMDVSSEISSGSSVTCNHTNPSGDAEVEVIETCTADAACDGFTPCPTAGQSSDGESGEESELSDWDVITIDDDEDDKPRVAVPGKEMICLRCPTKKIGTFKDEKKYWVHVKRHILPDHFVCPTCQRPFIKLNFLFSHELRVHGTPLPIESKDNVISSAKQYVKAKQEQTGGTATEANSNNTSMPNQETENETDSEDGKFYGNRFVLSTMIYPYKGPPVDTMLESYEIQNFFKSRPKASKAAATVLAKLAITVHEQNVQKNQDTYKLGRFSLRKRKIVKPPSPKKTKKVPKKKATVAKPKPPVLAVTAPAPLKRPRDPVSEGEKEKPKKKRVRYMYMTSSSDSDTDDDSDSAPKEKKGKSTDKIQVDKQDPVPSTSQQQKSVKKKGVTSGDLQIKYRQIPSDADIRKRYFSALLKPICQLCGFNWRNEYYLRLHREKHHPKNILLDLTTFTYEESRKKTKSKVNEGKKKAANGVKKVAKKKETKKKTSNPKKPPNVAANEIELEPVQERMVLRKARPQEGNLLRLRTAPPPDSTFSNKEKFLHVYGLTNRVRLHLHQRKPLNDLKLPVCKVMLERMSESDIKNSLKKPGVSSLDFPLHFLLK